MKKLIVKAEFVVTPYSPAIPGIPAVEAQPEKWVKGEETVFEAPQDLTDWIYHPAVEAVAEVPEVPEVLEVKEWRVIAQTQGTDEELAVWLAGDSFKYPAGYQVEYIDLAAEIEQADKFQQAMDEIAKGIKGIAVFKVKVKEKQLTGQQIAQLFASEEIKKIIETLSTGSLPLASSLIAAYVADGVIVTEDDKQAVLSAIG